MNRRPPSFLLVSQASEGFLQYKAAEGLSPRTLERYRDFFKIWRQYIDDARLNEITADKLRQFLIWLRTDYQPLVSPAHSSPCRTRRFTTSICFCRRSSPGQIASSTCPAH